MPRSTEYSNIKVLILRAFVLAAAAVILGVSLFVWSFDRQPLGGDEPHYLVMTTSLLRDHDLNVANDYAQERYRVFYNAHIAPHIARGSFSQNIEQTHQYSAHGPALAIFLVPFYALAGVSGATFAMVLVGWLVLALAWQWTKQVTGSIAAATVATLILFATIFWLGLIGYIYPDLLIAAAGLSGLVLYSRPKSPGWPWYLLVGFALGASLWVHYKTVIMVGPELLLLTWQLWRNEAGDKRKLLALWGPVVLLSGYLVIKTHEWFNVWLPNQIYGGKLFGFNLSPARSLPAMMFDDNKGLFTNNPVLLLLAAGLVPWFKRSRQTLLTAAAAAIPILALLSIFPEWQGGYAPSGRYPMEFLPYFTPALGFVWLKLKQPLNRVVFGGLIVVQIYLSTIFVEQRFKLTVGGDPSQLTKLLHFTFWPHYSAQTHLTNPHSRGLLVALLALLPLSLWWGRMLNKRGNQ